LDKNRLEFILFKFFVNLVQFIGRKKALLLAAALGNFFYYFIPIRKAVVKSNLQKAFPDKSKKQIDKIAKLNYVNFLKTMFDIFLIRKMTKEEILEIVDINGIEKLESLYAKGEGLVILTGHFGNWELGAVTLGFKMIDGVNVLTKPQRNPFVSEWMDNMRSAFGNRITNLGTGIRDLYKTLKQGGIIGIVGDQRGPREGTRVNLFNQPTAIYSGFAAIIAKSKSPVAVALIPRQSNDKYQIDLIDLDYNAESSEAIIEITQKYISILESYIRLYPDQWFWMHKIWKY